jgi:hypothetical protein
MAYNSQKLHDIMGIPLAERIPIMDALKTQTKSLATKEEQFRLIMGEFRKASAQNQSPDPIQLMEQVNVIYPNMI